MQGMQADPGDNLKVLERGKGQNQEEHFVFDIAPGHAVSVHRRVQAQAEEDHVDLMLEALTKNPGFGIMASEKGNLQQDDRMIRKPSRTTRIRGERRPRYN